MKESFREYSNVKLVSGDKEQDIASDIEKKLELELFFRSSCLPKSAL